MTPARKILLALAALTLAAAGVATIAAARMKSERIDKNLCETTGGGRFVGIPGFPGERIDRRLKRDVKLLVRRYKIFVTDGFSTDPVHSAKGEHPIGLALDIVPDRSRGGRWRDIGRLARWAEPKQNRPRPPFRWVGYDGDAGHGRGHHLHLSWAHSKARFGKPSRTVYTVRCPDASGGGKGGGGGDKGSGTPTPDAPTGKEPKDPQAGGGGISPGKGSRRAGRQESSGGLSYRYAKRKIRRQQRAGTSRERAGVDRR